MRNESGVAVYIYGGWFDLFSKDAFRMYNNLTVPQKIMIIDSPHSSGNNPDLVELYMNEQLRWYDYWLEGIKNSIIDEPFINIQKIGAQGKCGIKK